VAKVPVKFIFLDKCLLVSSGSAVCVGAKGATRMRWAFLKEREVEARAAMKGYYELSLGMSVY
jgi:hypothetical protein